nr:NTF2-related export protein 2 isoform X2 [Anser cygnoides]
MLGIAGKPSSVPLGLRREKWRTLQGSRALHKARSLGKPPGINPWAHTSAPSPPPGQAPSSAALARRLSQPRSGAGPRTRGPRVPARAEAAGPWSGARPAPPARRSRASQGPLRSAASWPPPWISKLMWIRLVELQKNLSTFIMRQWIKGGGSAER